MDMYVCMCIVHVHVHVRTLALPFGLALCSSSISADFTASCLQAMDRGVQPLSCTAVNMTHIMDHTNRGARGNHVLPQTLGPRIWIALCRPPGGT